nr:MAG TPA: hypothetical protein [Caudoviricetes sp.]
MVNYPRTYVRKHINRDLSPQQCRKVAHKEHDHLARQLVSPSVQ